MSTLFTLQEDAVQAAQQARWQDGVSINQEILEKEPENISALNRLGFCFLQLNSYDEAKSTYKKVLELDKYNTIAKKYLDLLENQKKIHVAPIVFQETFIEEPGKTKSVQLCRIADTKTLLGVAVGTACELKVKSHRVTVETSNGVYIGSLPDDLAHHLSKLIESGNEYKIIVQSVSKSGCAVFMKELKRSKKFAYTSSFPVSSMRSATEVHEELLIDQAPLDMSETGQDEEFAAEPTTLPSEEEGRGGDRDLFDR